MHLPSEAIRARKAHPVPSERGGIAVAMGLAEGMSAVHKFGANLDVAAGDDVWSRSSAWVAPTQARIHDLASTAAADDLASTGARTIRVHGLTAWDAAETTEELDLDGTNNVPTANAYVIIHRLECLTFGSGGTNAGTITATAQTDGTVTAEVAIGKGKTLMAIYGIPSGYSLLLDGWVASLRGPAASANGLSVELQANKRPDQTDGGFVVEDRISLYAAGSSSVPRTFGENPKRFQGPAIVRARVVEVSTASLKLEVSFDGTLVQE